MAGNKRSGRKRKPIELKVLEGTFRKDRDGGAPEAATGFPKAPSQLTEAEAVLWKQFPRVAWIAKSDQMAVHAAVSTYARILDNQMAQRVAEKPSRLISQEVHLWGRLMSILGTLGLTPADRAKMRTMPQVTDAEDKWAGIL